MIEWCFAVSVLRLISTGNQRNIDYPSSALCPEMRRRRNAMPDSAVMNDKVTLLRSDQDLILIIIIIEEIGFSEKHLENSLFVCTGQQPQPPVHLRGIIEV